MAEENPLNTEGHAPDTLGLSFPKADVLERYIAKLIDFLIVGAFFAFPTFIGPLAGLTYILISDGLMGGRSVGKRIIGLKAVSIIEDVRPCDLKGSIIRNSPFGALIVLFFVIGWIPYIGKFITFVVTAATIGLEMVIIYTDETGARFGDRIAHTLVVSASTPL